MTPIIVPTLAELRIELGRLDAVRQQASAANDAAPDNDELQQAWEAAMAACWHALEQIAELKAASLSDLRVKAYAFDWSARLVDGESYFNPTPHEERIMHQLVAGLLDERIA